MNTFLEHPLHRANLLQGLANLAREIVLIVNQGVETISPGDWPEGFGTIPTKRYACAMLGLNYQLPIELQVCRILVTYAIAHKERIIITIDDIRGQNLIINVPDIINLRVRVTQIEGTLQQMQQTQQQMQQTQQQILDAINALHPAVNIANNG
jgi:hypothetical protein